jgi:hypothetical protein
MKMKAMVFVVLVAVSSLKNAGFGQYAPPPSTPVLDSMATDWRAKVLALEARQEALEQRLLAVRAELGQLGASVSGGQQQLSGRLRELETVQSELFEELRRSRETPPAWLPELLGQHELRMAAVQDELETLRKSETAPARMSNESSYPPPRAAETLHLHLRCRCPAELRLDESGNWLLTERHSRGNTVRRVVPVTTGPVRSGWSVIATTGRGERLVSDSRGAAFEIVASR